MIQIGRFSQGNEYNDMSMYCTYIINTFATDIRNEIITIRKIRLKNVQLIRAGRERVN